MSGWFRLAVLLLFLHLPLLFQTTSMALVGVPCDQITEDGKFEPNLEIFPHRNLAQVRRRPLENYILQDWPRKEGNSS